jgi:hypothetical protein
VRKKQEVKTLKNGKLAIFSHLPRDQMEFYVWEEKMNYNRILRRVSSKGETGKESNFISS